MPNSCSTSDSCAFTVGSGFSATSQLCQYCRAPVLLDPLGDEMPIRIEMVVDPGCKLNLRRQGLHASAEPRNRRMRVESISVQFPILPKTVANARSLSHGAIFQCARQAWLGFETLFLIARF
jgi:hypothetical protein